MIAEASDQELNRARRPAPRRPAPGSTGRLSRHRPPRPSRHQTLTPKSRAPPDATSPGRTPRWARAGCPRSPRGRVRPRARPCPAASGRSATPRSGRYGSGRAGPSAGTGSGSAGLALDPRLVARSVPRREPGAGRHRAAVATTARPSAPTTVSAHRQVRPSVAPVMIQTVGTWSSSVVSRSLQVQPPGHCQQDHAEAAHDQEPVPPAPHRLHGPRHHLRESGGGGEPEKYDHLTGRQQIAARSRRRHCRAAPRPGSARRC